VIAAVGRVRPIMRDQLSWDPMPPAAVATPIFTSGWLKSTCTT
jgi:hypothetical protein